MHIIKLFDDKVFTREGERILEKGRLLEGGVFKIYFLKKEAFIRGGGGGGGGV